MANKKYVPQGTYLACDKGTVPMEFMITNNNNTFLFDEPVANTGDMVPMLNVMPMGVCMVTGSACVPAPIMWEGFEDGVFVGFFNPLLEDSVLQCTVGGKIEIFYSLEDAEGACAEEGMGFWEKLAVAVVVVAAVVLIVASGGAALAAVGAASAAYSAGAMGTMAVMGGVAALEVYGVYSGVKGLYNYSQDGDFESLAKDVALGYLFWGAGAAIGKGYKMYKANKLAKAIDEERILKEVFESMDHNGTGKNVIKIGDEALEAGDESLKLVEDINYSRKAYEKALKNHDVLPASKKVKTTASDGKNTVSGSSPKRISNKTRDAMGGVDDVS
ncbi:DUF4280 domain-containing protein [Zobellia laminariae]|uniref:DUF4280 domain-containing protein n=1 Tax=Zobellia laminariae TaxID=248906 RepID=UPI0026F4288E|nr:DUF4280 domain-containing protein [Zobellia laminariae]WKX76168.1 DUF4280 domain-containing protein [Zobellia laminariae]